MTNKSIWVLAPLAVLATLIMAANLYLVGWVQLILPSHAGSDYYPMTGDSDGASFPFIECNKWRGWTTDSLPLTFSLRIIKFKTLMASHFLLPSVRTNHSHKKSMMNHLLTLDYRRLFFLDFWILGWIYSHHVEFHEALIHVLRTPVLEATVTIIRTP